MIVRTPPISNVSVPRLRADAARNRETLIRVGKEMFTKRGVNTSLEDIARRAKVGIGTLYRHFPSRDKLVEAVYRHEVDLLARSSVELSERSESALALREWMQGFIEYVATKKVLASSLCAPLPTASELASASSAKILEALTSLVEKAIRDQEIRGDVAPDDLLRALAGFSYGAVGPNWKVSARRLTDVLMDGLGHGKATRKGQGSTLLRRS